MNVFASVVIGIDGREGGPDAIALAKQIAPEATFTLAHVACGPRAWWDREISEEEIPFLRQTKLMAAEREAAGIDARIVCVTASSPARGLHELARRLAADLIVVGSCSRGPLGRVLIGDDARASVAGAPCAVAVPPRGFASRRGASGLDQAVIEGVANEL
jgi:nucleotide-binding universal stress UspA family protein